MEDNDFLSAVLRLTKVGAFLNEHVSPVKDQNQTLVAPLLCEKLPRQCRCMLPLDFVDGDMGETKMGLDDVFVEQLARSMDQLGHDLLVGVAAQVCQLLIRQARAQLHQQQPNRSAWGAPVVFDGTNEILKLRLLQTRERLDSCRRHTLEVQEAQAAVTVSAFSVAFCLRNLDEVCNLKTTARRTKETNA